MGKRSEGRWNDDDSRRAANILFQVLFSVIGEILGRVVAFVIFAKVAAMVIGSILALLFILIIAATEPGGGSGDVKEEAWLKGEVWLKGELRQVSLSPRSTGWLGIGGTTYSVTGVEGEIINGTGGLKAWKAYVDTDATSPDERLEITYSISRSGPDVDLFLAEFSDGSRTNTASVGVDYDSREAIRWTGDADNVTLDSNEKIDIDSGHEGEGVFLYQPLTEDDPLVGRVFDSIK